MARFPKRAALFNFAHQLGNILLTIPCQRHDLPSASRVTRCSRPALVNFSRRNLPRQPRANSLPANLAVRDGFIHVSDVHFDGPHALRVAPHFVRLAQEPRIIFGAVLCGWRLGFGIFHFFEHQKQKAQALFEDSRLPGDFGVPSDPLLCSASRFRLKLYFFKQNSVNRKNYSS